MPPLTLSQPGLRAFPVTSAVWRGFAGVVSLALSLALSACGTAHQGPAQHRSQSVPMDQTMLTRVEITMGAGEFQVDGGSTNLMDADFDYTDPASNPAVEYHSTGTRSDLTIREPDGGSSGNDHYKWRLRLNDKANLDVVAKLGAGQANMNLGNLNLRNVELNMGAGQVDMDLRGLPKQSYEVRV
ncbi:MAG: toast rack family protein, partial [Acidobacteriota bacterium]